MKLSKALGMALLLALGVLVGWNMGLFDSPSESKDDVVLFPDLDIRTINFLGITSKDQLSALEKGKNGEWLFTHPEGNPVDQDAVRDVLKAIPRLKTVSNLGLVDDPERQQEFGLNEPEIEVSFGANGKSMSLVFGKLHTFSGRRYLRYGEDQRVYSVNESQVVALNRNPFELMDKTPLNFDASRVRELWIKGYESPVVQFVFESDAKWHAYSEGKEVVADTTLVEDMLERLANLEVRHFVTVPEKALSAYGLKPPMLSLRLEFDQSSKELVVLFGATKRIRGSLSAETSAQLNLEGVGLEEYFKKDYTKAADKYLKEIEWSYYFKTGDSAWSAKARTPLHRAFMRPLGDFQQKTILAPIASDTLDSVELSQGVNNPTEVIRSDKSGRFGHFLKAVKEFRVLSFAQGVEAPKDWEDYCKFSFKTKNSANLSILEVGPPVDSGYGADNEKAPRFARFTKGKDSPILIVVSFDSVDTLLAAWKEALVLK